MRKFPSPKKSPRAHSNQRARRIGDSYFHLIFSRDFPPGFRNQARCEKVFVCGISLCVFLHTLQSSEEMSARKIKFQNFLPTHKCRFVDVFLIFSLMKRSRKTRKTFEAKRDRRGRKRQAAQIGSKSNLTERICRMRTKIVNFPISDCA